MEHFDVLALLIQEHKKKYNEQRRLCHRLTKLRRGSDWDEILGSEPAMISCDKLEYSDPHTLQSTGLGYVGIHFLVHIKLPLRKDQADYRKWCRTAAQWRRVKREVLELLNGIRAVGKVYGTKVQTRSNDGNSFNRPFFIEIEGRKIPIKEFMSDQVFEDIVLRDSNE